MATIVRYNGSNPFGTYTPEISVQVVPQDNNGYISKVDRYTLEGTRRRTGCSMTLQDYKNDIDAILAAFRLQFKLFEVVENGTVIFSYDKAMVVSITFPETSFTSFYKYEIIIDCPRSFNGVGIENPTESYETSQADSGITTIKHTIACRGIGPNGVQNAIAFVDARKAAIIPEAYAESPELKAALLSRSYSINRLTAEVTLNLSYVYDEDDKISEYCTLTYTSELQEREGSTTITIRGTFQGNAVDGSGEMDKARNRFNATDWQAIAQTEWQFFGGTTLLAEHSQFSVTESPLTAEVGFVITWNTETQEGVYVQETWTIARNYQGEPTCFSYQGVVKTDFGCTAQRFQAVKDLANTINWKNRVAILWAQYGTGESLSTVAKSQSRTDSPFTGTVSVGLTYCHDPSQSCGCFENMEYTLAFVEPIEQYASQPILRAKGRQATQDLGFVNRRRFSISGSARAAKCCTIEQAKSAIKTRLNFLSSYYFNYTDKILEAAEMEATALGDVINFNYTWNAAA